MSTATNGRRRPALAVEPAAVEPDQAQRALDVEAERERHDAIRSALLRFADLVQLVRKATADLRQLKRKAKEAQQRYEELIRFERRTARRSNNGHVV